LGERVEDAGADVDVLRRVRQVAADDVVGRQVRVLVEEVMLRDPDVLEPDLVGDPHRFELIHEHLVLRFRITCSTELRVVALDEKSELHVDAPSGAWTAHILSTSGVRGKRPSGGTGRASAYRRIVTAQ